MFNEIYRFGGIFWPWLIIGLIHLFECKIKVDFLFTFE